MISYLKLGVLVKHVKENLGHQTANLHSSQWEKSTQIPKLFIMKKPAKNLEIALLCHAPLLQVLLLA